MQVREGQDTRAVHRVLQGETFSRKSLREQSPRGLLSTLLSVRTRELQRFSETVRGHHPL